MQIIVTVAVSVLSNEKWGGCGCECAVQWMVVVRSGYDWETNWLLDFQDDF